MIALRKCNWLQSNGKFELPDKELGNNLEETEIQEDTSEQFCEIKQIIYEANQRSSKEEREDGILDSYNFPVCSWVLI